MATIKVHLMNWHGIFSHIDIMLENKSASPTTYYYINQWAKPTLHFAEQLKVIAASEVIDADAADIINASSSTYVFEIQADHALIAKAWVDYYHATEAKTISNHCALAAQWFLNEFANIPAPNPISAAISLNHLALELFIPNSTPIGIALPGRIMENAKFYIEARKTPDLIQQYSTLFLQVCAAISLLTLASSLADVIAASICLSHPNDPLIIASHLSTINTSGFFNTPDPLVASNQRAQKNEKLASSNSPY